jgi:hypothetical protein
MITLALAFFSLRSAAQPRVQSPVHPALEDFEKLPPGGDHLDTIKLDAVYHPRRVDLRGYGNVCAKRS